MNARRYDNLLRYQVDSGSRSEVKHLVELDMYGGNGSCSCEAFTYRLEPYLKKGARATGDQLRCKHIIAARNRLADDIIQQISHNEKTALQASRNGRTVKRTDGQASKRNHGRDEVPRKLRS